MVDRVALSNAHAVLAEELKATTKAAAVAERVAVANSIKAGEILCRARAEIPHGQWGAFLKRAAVHERQARRLMQLARSCLKPDMVSDLGGVAATLQWLGEWSFPEGDDALVVWSGDDPTPARFTPIVLLWPRGGELVDVGYLCSPEFIQVSPRGLYRDGAWLLISTMLNPAPSKWKRQTLYGQGPFWRELAGEALPVAN